MGGGGKNAPLFEEQNTHQTGQPSSEPDDDDDLLFRNVDHESAIRGLVWSI